MLAGLSTAHQIGLGVCGLAFVLFALVTSMVIPRRNPDFPGRRKGLYIAVCFLFFVGMLAAVLVFGKEQPEPARGEAAALVATHR
jgi:hypothetical protein